MHAEMFSKTIDMSQRIIKWHMTSRLHNLFTYIYHVNVLHTWILS